MRKNRKSEKERRRREKLSAAQPINRRGLCLLKEFILNVLQTSKCIVLIAQGPSTQIYPRNGQSPQ